MANEHAGGSPVPAPPTPGAIAPRGIPHPWTPQHRVPRAPLPVPTAPHPPHPTSKDPARMGPVEPLHQPQSGLCQERIGHTRLCPTAQPLRVQRAQRRRASLPLATTFCLCSPASCQGPQNPAVLPLSRTPKLLHPALPTSPAPATTVPSAGLASAGWAAHAGSHPPTHACPQPLGQG